MPDQPKPLRKAEKPLVIWFRLYGDDKRRMLALTAAKRGKHNAIAYDGTLAELARLEAHAAGVTPAEAKALANFRRLTGLDPIPVLARATREALRGTAA